jgi:hypothetical protein
VEAFQPLSPPLTLPVASQSVSHSTCRAVRPRPRSGQPAVGPAPDPTGCLPWVRGQKNKKDTGEDMIMSDRCRSQNNRTGSSLVGPVWPRLGPGEAQSSMRALIPPTSPPPQSVGQSVPRPGVPADRKRRRKKEVDGQTGGGQRRTGIGVGVVIEAFFFPSSGSFYFILFRFATPLETTTVCVDLG